MSIAQSIDDLQKVSASVVFNDAAGKSVPAPSMPTWAIDNPAVVTIVPAADGMSCEITSVAPGVANMTVTDGAFTDTGVITVTAAPAAAMVLSFGAPVAK